MNYDVDLIVALESLAPSGLAISRVVLDPDNFLKVWTSLRQRDRDQQWAEKHEEVGLKEFLIYTSLGTVTVSMEEDPMNREVVIATGGPCVFSEALRERLAMGRLQWSVDQRRDDPRLVKAVKELGPYISASGNASLSVVTIPEDWAGWEIYQTWDRPEAGELLVRQSLCGVITGFRRVSAGGDRLEAFVKALKGAKYTKAQPIERDGEPVTCGDDNEES